MAFQTGAIRRCVMELARIFHVAGGTVRAKDRMGRGHFSVAVWAAVVRGASPRQPKDREDRHSDREPKARGAQRVWFGEVLELDSLGQLLSCALAWHRARSSQ
jgi:hypothetical protein